MVQLLLDNGADVNIQGGKNGSPLATAIITGDCRIVQLLIDRGADVNLKGGEYGCPLAAEMASGEQKIVQLLIESNAITLAQSKWRSRYSGFRQCKSGRRHRVYSLIDITI